MDGSQVKIILDTSIYIPYINRGISHPALEIKTGRPLLYMSAVVLKELYAGALDSPTVKLLDRLYSTFRDVGRLVVPQVADWRKAGGVIAAMGKKHGFERLFLSRISSDVLIALSARRIGAYVVTNNAKDFLRIKEFVDFRMYG
jgi:hypothetical protein